MLQIARLKLWPISLTHCSWVPHVVKQTMWEVTRGVAVPMGAQLFFICLSSRVGAMHPVAYQLPKRGKKNMTKSLILTRKLLKLERQRDQIFMPSHYPGGHRPLSYLP